MSSFNGINTVRSGLSAAQRALEVIGQNVANANTVGYSRQEVSITAAEPTQVINGTGRGIRDVNVLRYRDEFLDRQFRTNVGAQGFHDTRSSELKQVESVVGDLSQNGLRTALDSMFNSWQNLSMRPTDTTARQLVISSSQTFLDSATTAFNGLMQLRTDMDQSIQNKVADINSAANQLADLNRQIVAGGHQQTPNDLMDRRDQLIDSLSKMTGATATKQLDGSVTVHIGAIPLVDRNGAYPITATTAMEPDLDPNPAVTSTQQPVTSLTWNGTNVALPVPSGDLAALVDLRDHVLPTHMMALDNLVRTVANQVNAAHTNGVPAASQVNVFVFDPNNTWMNVSINPVITGDPSQILAAGTVPAAVSDGDRARFIGNLRDQAILTGNPVGSQSVKPGDYLQAIQSQIGMQVQDATRSSEAAGLQVTQAENLRQSVAGVSLDDEMTKMIQFQQAYNASARMMTSLDQMLDTLITGVGIVGR
jgi:flagellar hook-associated protein 1 FlgK